MAPKPNVIGTLPWTQDQFDQMKQMLSETIPNQEDMLKRAEKAGLNVDKLKADLATHKQRLSGLISAWQDKYQ